MRNRLPALLQRSDFSGQSKNLELLPLNALLTLALERGTPDAQRAMPRGEREVSVRRQ
jgi:hypothetical protein